MTFHGAWDTSGVEAVSVELWNWEDGNKDKWIRFEEPCPQIEWAGTLKRARKASVTKDDVEPVHLSIFNPRKADGTLERLAENGRLNHVHAFYREVGDHEWIQARLSEVHHKEPIDFANIPDDTWKESAYGYTTIPWDIGSIMALSSDGSYEVVVKSMCTELEGAPTEFNTFATDPITLVVDRVQPELYGKALPVRDIVVPGEETVMIFTEAIRCGLPYRFDLEVRVSGLEDKSGEERLFGKKMLQGYDCIVLLYKH